MPTLAEVLVISIASSVVFSLIAFLSTVLWIRLRRRRASVLLSQRILEQGQISQTNAVNTPGQGTLRASFTFPYSTPREWDVIGSSETVHQTAQDTERRRSLFDIFSTRSSRHQKEEEHNDVPLDRIASTSTKADRTQSGDEKAGAFEDVDLKADSAPNHTSERHSYTMNIKAEGFEEDGTLSPATTVRRLPRETTEPVDPGMKLMKRHSTSTLGQPPGSPPKLPVPPLPAHYVPGQSRLVKRNSALDLSNMSLDTADSSILNLSPQRNRFSDGPHIGLKRQSRNELRYSTSRYSVSSAGSRRLTKEFPSPKRSVSAPQTGDSPFTAPVQSPAPDFSRHPSQSTQTLQQIREDTCSISRTLTSAQPLSARSRNQYNRPPPTYGLKEPSVFDMRRSSETSLNNRSVLKPTTGNGRSFGIHSANFSISASPPKSSRNSATSLRSLRVGHVPSKPRHRRQNCIRIPIYAPAPVRNSLATTVEEDEESPEPKEINRQEAGSARNGTEGEHKAVTSQQQTSDKELVTSNINDSPFETTQSSPDGSSESTPGKPSSSPCPKRFAPPRRSALRGPPASALKTFSSFSAMSNTSRRPPRSATASLDKTALDLGAKLIQNIDRPFPATSASFGYATDQKKNPVARLPRTVSLRGRTPDSYTAVTDHLSPLPEADTPHEEDSTTDDEEEEDTSETPKAGNSPTSTVTPSREGSCSTFVRTPGSIYDQYGFLKEWKA